MELIVAFRNSAKAPEDGGVVRRADQKQREWEMCQGSVRTTHLTFSQTGHTVQRDWMRVTLTHSRTPHLIASLILLHVYKRHTIVKHT